MLIVGALAGCAGDPTPPEPLDPCTGAVTVSVTAGTTPAGATQNEAALPLLAGVLYDITFFGGTLASPIPIGNFEFTP